MSTYVPVRACTGSSQRAFEARRHRYREPATLLGCIYSRGCRVLVHLCPVPGKYRDLVELHLKIKNAAESQLNELQQSSLMPPLYLTRSACEQRSP